MLTHWLLLINTGKSETSASRCLTRAEMTHDCMCLWQGRNSLQLEYYYYYYYYYYY